jgi:hypothetical protein
MMSSTCHYAVVNVVHSVIFVPRDSGVKRFLYAWFTHLYPYIYICIRILPYAYRPGFLAVDCMADGSTRVLGRPHPGASISRGSPGLLLSLPYIYIYEP